MLGKGAGGFERSGHQLPPRRKQDTPGRVPEGPAEHSLGSDLLPCLYRNISTDPPIEEHEKSSPDPLKLKAKYRKTACALAWNVQYMAERYDINKLGFLTLTFADHVTDSRESQSRFNSLRTHVLNFRYQAYVRVLERQKSGRIHYHLVVVLPGDIRTGFDFQRAEKGDYKSANKLLRSEWQYWRETAKNYGFGRTELLPIKSTAEGIGRYVGKYIGKHFESRKIEDKGIRLVDYSRGARMATVRHTPLNKGTELWRSKICLFAQIAGYRLGLGRSLSYSEFSEYLGPKWAYNNREFILDLPDTVFDGNELENFIKATAIESVLDQFCVAPDRTHESDSLQAYRACDPDHSK